MTNNRDFNLLTTPWLPVLRASGKRETVRPADITDGIDTDPIVEIDWPRADFRCATLEFLIGLLTVACPPRGNEDWIERWDAPPSVIELEAALAPLEGAFAFDGDGPRAYQDFEDLVAEPNPIEALLIEAPGAQTVKNNAALLVKPGRVETLSRSATAMALVTLQTMAPAGGAGHRTSLRGGGPLTTLVLPAARTSLWHRLWANVPSVEAEADPEQLPLIFPWLAPTRVSGKDGRPTTPVDVDERQTFFGMPRRIRLDFERNAARLPCDLTGEIDDVIVRTYRTRPHGANYDAWGGRHPLTPHYRSKASDPALYPIHGQDGRMGYRQWVAMLYGDNDGLRYPAACVARFVRERNGDLPRGERGFRLTAAGYDMDNMKARAFVEAETPEIAAPEGDANAVAAQARDFVAAANVVAGSVGYAVKMALYGEDADDRIKRLHEKTPLTTATERFWADTNDAFFDTLNDISAQPEETPTETGESPRGKQWLAVMRQVALTIFDDTTPVQDADTADVKRVVDGRRFLLRTLLGYGKRGTDLFKPLHLVIPETKARKGKRA